MKAVNLIPADQRRGAGGTAGRAGGAVYVLLGGLAVLVVMSVLYAVSAGQVSDRQSKLTQVNTQADVVQSQAGSLQAYVTFASLRQSREQAIASLAAGRFDWAASMDQIARALPNDVTLSALTGAPTGSTPGAPAATPAPSTTAPASSGPSIALTGCASTHSEVANVLVALHRVVGVTSVSLATSQKQGAGQAPSAGTCAGAQFTATLVYSASSASSTQTTTPNTNGVTAATGTSPTAGSTR
jgi:Tfp pilus assembly protein PilN